MGTMWTQGPLALLTTRTYQVPQYSQSPPWEGEGKGEEI